MLYNYEFEDASERPFFIIHAENGITYRLDVVSDGNIISVPLKSGGKIRSLYLFPSNPSKGKIRITDHRLKRTVVHCLKGFQQITVAICYTSFLMTEITGVP